MTRFMISRRQALLGAASLCTAPKLVFGQGTAPAVVTAASARPVVAGVTTGDVDAGNAVVWARADRPARMVLEWSTTEDFEIARRVPAPHVLPEGDFIGRVDLTGLPAGQDIFTRVSFASLDNGKTLAEPVTGHFRTAPAGPRDIRFQWSGDLVGQGWGINPDLGGMKIFEVMRRANPDFFINSGDTIYADGPISAEVKLPDGKVWKNLVTPEKSKVAETLDEFRGNYRYTWMDEHFRRFMADVPQIWQWDDHEVTNNWSDSKDLSGDKRYTERNVPLLVARAARAFLDYAPLRLGSAESERVYRRISYGSLLDVFVVDMRSYRGPNTANLQTREGAETQFLGAEQIRWLKRGLLNSRATWKVIAADMPIGLDVPDGKTADGQARWEAIANGDGGAPKGREMEIAGLLSALKHNEIRNVVWLTADVHYTAAHYYNPAKAQFADFDGFWEFVSGPLNAGTFGPNRLDATFGPELRFVKAPEAGQVNLSPLSGMQFYGEVGIEARTGLMTVYLKDMTGATLFEQKLEPARA
ncbi:MAG: alkaline phosphatase [Acetobacteraceae bacterium]